MTTDLLQWAEGRRPGRERLYALALVMAFELGDEAFAAEPPGLAPAAARSLRAAFVRAVAACGAQPGAYARRRHPRHDAPARRTSAPAGRFVRRPNP